MTTPFQERMRKLALDAGVTEGVLDASGHPYECRCDLCKAWWRAMGPVSPGDPDDLYSPSGPYGPFTVEEIEDVQSN